MTNHFDSLEDKDSGISLREKTAWICFLSTLAVYTPYFAHLVWLLVGGEFKFWRVFSAMFSAVLIQVLLLGVCLCFFAGRSRQESRDERDIGLERRACRNAYFILAAGCFSVIMAAPGYTLGMTNTNQPVWFVPLLMTQGLLLCFVVAETIRYGTLALGYRRGK